MAGRHSGEHANFEGAPLMAELKSFAADACWALIDETRSALRSPAQRRWCLGVTAYLVFAFLMGNALSEMWKIY
jgi:hypothetical protein